jgi:hypothetical protein
MNYLELVNAVLVKLREDEVSSYNQDTYSALIASFINEAKEEVENAWNWSMLRTAVTMATTASQSYVEVLRTSLGPRDTIISMRDATNLSCLGKIGAEAYYDYLYGATTPVESKPNYWILTKASDPSYTRFSIYPTPDDAYNLYAIIIQRQAELSNDATELLVPSRPVILGAYYKAIKERGEDMGDASQQAAADYKMSLGDAISMDAANQHEEESSWQVR